MKRDPHLHILSHGHHHGLSAAANVQKMLDATPDGDTLAELAKQVHTFWQVDLLPHFRAEEEAVLPMLTRHLGADEPIVTRVLSDHICLHRDTVLLLEQSDSASDCADTLHSWAERLSGHIRFEESGFLEKVQELLDPEQLEWVGRQIEGLDVSGKMVPQHLGDTFSFLPEV